MNNGEYYAIITMRREKRVRCLGVVRAISNVFSFWSPGSDRRAFFIRFHNKRQLLCRNLICPFVVRKNRKKNALLRDVYPGRNKNVSFRAHIMRLKDCRGQLFHIYFPASRAHKSRLFTGLKVAFFYSSPRARIVKLHDKESK